MNEDRLWEAMVERAVRDVLGRDLHTIGSGRPRTQLRREALRWLRSSCPQLAERCRREIPAWMERES